MKKCNAVVISGQLSVYFLGPALYKSKVRLTCASQWLVNFIILFISIQMNEIEESYLNKCGLTVHNIFLI